MLSAENTTLSRIQQEIQDVVNREAELKKLNSINGASNYSDNNNNEEESAEEQKTTLTRIQEDIQNVLDRERELREREVKKNNGFASNGNSQGLQEHEEDLLEGLEDQTDRCSNHSGLSSATVTSKGNEESLENDSNPVPVSQEQQKEVKTTQVRAPLLRAISASIIEEHQRPPVVKPHFRRVVSSNPNPNKGVMQRFLKSRGKLAAVASIALQKSRTPFSNVPGPTTNGFQSADPRDYELAPPKVIPGNGGKFLRRNYIPTDQKIKLDIETSYKRESELKTLRQSQGNLTQLDDTTLDAPLDNYGLRGSKSMAQLYSSDEHLDEQSPSASAPTSLKPAKSLAELCDAKDEEVTSPRSLITHFQQMIIKNQESKRT